MRRLKKPSSAAVTPRATVKGHAQYLKDKNATKRFSVNPLCSQPLAP